MKTKIWYKDYLLQFETDEKDSLNTEIMPRDF